MFRHAAWLAILLGSIWLSPAASPLDYFLVRTWDARDGLAQDAVKAIAQTPDGYLWIATFGGLSRFDGSRFQNFRAGNTPNLPENLVNALFCDRLGRLWIGHDSGFVTVMERGRFRQIKMPADWSQVPIREFGEDAEGNVWVINLQWHLAIINSAGESLPLPPPDDKEIPLHFGCSAKDANLRLITQRGQCYVARGKELTPDPDAPPRASDGRRVICSPRGGYWAVLDGHLTRWMGGKKVEDAGEVNYPESIYATTCEWNGFVAAGTFLKGLNLTAFDGSHWQMEAPADLPSNWISVLFVDRGGILWAGTGDGGIFAVTSRRVRMILPPGESMQHYFELLRDKVWSGSLLRREFDVKSVEKARLYICGLGYYRAYLNGKKIGNRDLAPSDSHFIAHAYYQVYDVSELLQSGQNCLGVELVNGRWRAWPGNTAETYNDRPILLVRLEITDKLGNTKNIVSDGSWQCGQSAIRRSNFWIGELYDARAKQEGWSTSGFNAADWIPAREAKAGATVQALSLDPMPPEKMTDLVPPVKQTEPKPKVYVYDFGRMIGGRARFVFHGLKRGQRVVVRYAEAIDDRAYDAPYAIAYYDNFDNTKQESGMLKFKRRGSVSAEGIVEVARPDGSIEKQSVPGGAMAYTDIFVSAGKDEEVWLPNFTYTGFRYLEILGLDEALPMGDVAAFDLRTHPEIIGSLTTDNAQLNRILQGVQDTILLCFHSQLQDNNGAERNPNAHNLALNDLNLAYWINVYPLWLKGAEDTVKINTLLGWPVNMVCGMRDVGSKKKRELNISNSLHYGHLPWDLISFYDDARSADRLLPWTIAFVKEASEHTVWETTYGSADHIATSSLKGLPSKGWVKNDRLTDPQFVKAGFIIRTAKFGIQVAEKLHHPAEAQELKRLLNEFEPRVVRTFFDQKKAEWTPDYPTIQGRNLTLMYFMMQPRRSDRDLCAEIVREIHKVTGGHQITGSRLSYPLLHELSQNGFQDEAMRLLLREEYPSLLEMIQQTGNAIRESWGTMDSFAQIEGLTEMGKWFYTDLVGIEPSIEHPAFAEFSLKPIVPARVGSCEFFCNSPRGIIKSNWKKSLGLISWKVVVPPNATAEVFIPATASQFLLIFDGY